MFQEKTRVIVRHTALHKTFDRRREDGLKCFVGDLNCLDITFLYVTYSYIAFKTMILRYPYIVSEKKK